jgi:hypothetical protein
MFRARSHPDSVSQRNVNAWNSLNNFHLPGSVDWSWIFKDAGEAAMGAAIPHAAMAYPPEHMTDHIEIRKRSGMRPGGYGILIASGIVGELIYSDVGNEVLLIKYKSVSGIGQSSSDETWIRTSATIC